MRGFVLTLTNVIFGVLCGLAQSTLDIYPNLETIGVHVDLSTEDLEGDANAELWYGLHSSKLKKGLPLDKVYVSKKRLSGVILWCQESTEYFIKVVIRDPTTPELEIGINIQCALSKAEKHTKNYMDYCQNESSHLG